MAISTTSQRQSGSEPRRSEAIPRSNTRVFGTILGVSLLGGAIALACSAADSGGAPKRNLGGGQSPNPGAAGGSNVGGPGANDDAGLPPEKEERDLFRAPVITGNLVWSANPVSGRVALIDAQTLNVKLSNAGLGPTYVAAVPTADQSESAIVLNVGSADATWFRVEPGSGEIQARTFKTHVGANAWAISKDGRFAIAWSRNQKQDDLPLDPIEGFQELTVIRLDFAAASDPAHQLATRLTVGFRPSQIAFNAEGTRAYAVVDEGISVIELSEQPSVLELYEVSDDPLDQVTHDISFTSDAHHAFVRVDGVNEFGVIDLSTGVRNKFALAGALTDLDLSADGTRAFAMIGDRSELVVIPVPPTDSTAFETLAVTGELVRSVTLTNAADTALLYTTTGNSRLTIVKTDPTASDYLSHRTVELKAPIQAVFPAPNSETAIVKQGRPPDSAKAAVFSVVPLRALRSPKIVGTDAPVLDVAVGETSGVVTVRDQEAKKFAVYTVGLTGLSEALFPLASEPLDAATGLVTSANRAFVAQRHPEGRISFVELTSGRVTTLTGFEISARVK